MTTGPLCGIRVLELGTLIAGPFCARLLAEFGADVIKIESPGDGDPLRQWRQMHEGTSLWWTLQARNKRSVTLNLKDPRARAIALQLALDADVVIENFRPGVLEQWGLGYETLRQTHPSLVMVRLSGYGQTGPMREQPGFGAIAESMGGIRYISGHADRPPVRIGISIGDSLAALHGAFGALAALRHRDQTGGRAGGVGQMVDVALYEAVFNMMESSVPEYDLYGIVRERSGGALPGIVPSNTYTCADTQSIVIAANGDAIFKRLMTAIGREDLGQDPSLARNDGRVARADEIERAIALWTATQSAACALDILAAAEVPAGRIYSVADMRSDPQFIAREMFESHLLASGQPITLPAVVPKLSETPGGTRWLGPALGQHTDAVLAELGYSDAQRALFKEQGVT